MRFEAAFAIIGKTFQLATIFADPLALPVQEKDAAKMRNFGGWGAQQPGVKTYGFYATCKVISDGSTAALGLSGASIDITIVNDFKDSCDNCMVPVDLPDLSTSRENNVETFDDTLNWYKKVTVSIRAYIHICRYAYIHTYRYKYI